MDSHKNFAYSTVATVPSPASSGTSLVVASGDGSLFPSVSFNATVWPAGVQPSAANAEIVRVTAISTDTFTIVRAQESSSARAIVVGDQIAATVTTKTLTDIESVIPASTAALPDSTNKRYVTDAELVVLGNTSGANSGDQTSVSGNAGTATKLATARNIDGQSFDGSADVTVVAPGTHAATSKTTPADADEIPIVDSAASNVLKKLTGTNLKAYLKTYFDTLYSAIGATHFVGTTSIANNRASASQSLTGITSIDGLAATATALATPRAIDGQNFDGTAAVTVIAPGTHAASAKTAPIDADEIPLVDTAASNVLKKVTVANLRSAGGWSSTFDIVNSSTTTSMLSQSIPGNTLGANGAIHCIVEGFYFNNSGASRGLSVGVSLGATTLWFDTSSATLFPASATVNPFYMELLLANEGATNAQRVSGCVFMGPATAASTAGVGTLSGTLIMQTVFTGTSAIDTTAAATLAVKIKHSAADANLELKGSVHARVVT